MITPESLIEDIVVEVPGAVTYLMNKGVRCLVCGEPLWGTLRNAALEKGFSEDEIRQFAEDLNTLPGKQSIEMYDR